MPRLKIITQDKTKEINFSGAPRLSDLLKQEGYLISTPCGGSGKCGKCDVELVNGISQGDNPQWEHVLACKTILQGDITVKLSEGYVNNLFVETETAEIQPRNCNFKYGAAVDIGTTTVALSLFDSKGEIVSQAVSINPQSKDSADVMGRISSALNGSLSWLNSQINVCVIDLLNTACAKVQILPTEVEKAVITGNTAMLYLLCGLNPKSISTAPFNADNLFDIEINTPINAYLPPCINAFVGADLVCAVIASGLCDKNQTALLCDIGTNGETALWKNGKLYVTSAAAGPAFEGGEISCGVPCIDGAVDKVWLENYKISTHTVNNLPAVGICGSGLLDAVAVFLDQGYIDASGALPSALNLPTKGKAVSITADDIRALQLAKSAIFSAVETLLNETSTTMDEINVFYLAGGFGNRLDISSATKIGLIPKELSEKTIQIGNGALQGAAMLLIDDNLKERAREISQNAAHIQLGGNTFFNKRFVENMSF